MTLKIEDLDEFEGLTADMVRAWLRAKGWTVKRADRFREWWEKGAEGEEDGFWLPAEFGVEWFWIHALAAVHGLTVQSLLREINPRMRAGWPSEEEIQRHARWIARNQNTGTVVVGVVKPDEEHGAVLKLHSGFLAKAFADGWSFWPCDQHGNKTRRGA